LVIFGLKRSYNSELFKQGNTPLPSSFVENLIAVILVPKLGRFDKTYLKFYYFYTFCAFKAKIKKKADLDLEN
jgi:hypothetical protein